MKYNYNGTEKVIRFSCDERGNLLSRVITMKSSKFISDYSIETFKCNNLKEKQKKTFKYCNSFE